MDGPAVLSMALIPSQKSVQSSPEPQTHAKSNQVGTVSLYGIHIVSLVIEGQVRLCLAQISNTLLKQFSYNEIHNRRVALGITCVQCTPVQLEMLRRAGAMPPSSRRCGMITKREAERLCKSFLSDNTPPRLPDDFAFSVHHECAWGSRGAFLPSRYNSSRAKCIKCSYCGLFFSPNKFIFHSHQKGPTDKFVQPDAANFNSWRRHMKLSGNPPDDIVHAWEDVKAMFNGGTRKRMLSKPGRDGSQTDEVVHAWEDVKAIFNGGSTRKRSMGNSGNSRESPAPAKRSRSSPTAQIAPPSLPVQQPSHPRVPPFPELPLPLSRSLVMDYVWHQHQQAAAVAACKTPGFPFPPYGFSWIAKRGLLPGPLPPPLAGTASTEPLMSAAVAAPVHQSAFHPVIRSSPVIVELATVTRDDEISRMSTADKDVDSDDEVDIETMEDEEPPVQGIGSSKNFNSGLQNLRGNVAPSNSGTGSDRGASPQCWSPARETEREAEEAAALRDVKPEIHSTKSLESWHGSAFYQHLNILKANGESSDRSTPDCSACRPRGMFYGQVQSPPASTN